MKKILIIIFCFSIVQGENGENISFKYGILGHHHTNPDSIIELSDRSIVYTGDGVRINIGYTKDSYFYLIYLDSEGEFYMEIPDSSTDGNKMDTLYTTILQGNLKNPPGLEIFYLLNSEKPLSDLTKLISRYDSAPEKGKIKLGKKIQSHIDALDPGVKADLSSIASRLDKPLVGGVAFRGDEDDELKDMSLTHKCNGISGIAFKKITLIHK